jgi:predicted membrane protein
MQRIVSILSAIVAISVGVIVLLGYFLPPFLPFKSLLLEWAVVIAGVAVIVGVGNLVFVHWDRMRSRQKGSSYSALLLLALIATFGLGVVYGPEGKFRQVTVDAIIVPVEATLMAMLAVTLIYASIRLLRRRADVMSVVFLVVALVSLLLIMPTPIGPIPGDQSLLLFLGMFSHGGARGLLLGIALGTMLTGLRVLFGADRPYGGN